MVKTMEKDNGEITITQKSFCNDIVRVYGAVFEDLGNDLLNVKNFPEAYCGADDKKDVKAIFLGTDPTIKKNPSEKLDHAFAIEKKAGSEEIKSWGKLKKGDKDDNKKKNNLRDNLEEIGLGLDELYIQNLCKNYFNDVTSEIIRNHGDIWMKIASIWVDILKEELDKFDEDVPVLITAGILRKVLCDKKYVEESNYNLYKNKKFCKPKNNRLGRIIIPFYRHKKYRINKHKGYAESVKKEIK